MKKVLVTGGLGFIGSHFIHYMLTNYPNCEVYNLDARTYAGKLENAAEAESSPRYHYYEGNILDVDLVEKIFAKGIDTVVHFAAESHVDRSIQSPEIFVESNVLGTLRLLEAAKKYKVSRFVHISTDEVYGTLGPTGAFTEQTPLAPNSPYSASKAGSDFIARSYYETYGLPVLITRCSNNYGPKQLPEKWIPVVITKALKNEKIPVYGDGQNVRDWLYVEDHCRGIDHVLQFGKPGEVYNIGGNNERTNLDIAKSILKRMGKPESLLEFVPDRLGHDRRYAIDASKLKRETGWEPLVPFEEGLRRTIDWYKRRMS